MPQWTCNACRGIGDATTTFRPKNAARLTTAEQLRQAGPARTRFAPSPTGYLHLGSLRTALFNFMIAKATGGQFLLRIEDTDQKRTVKDAEERLYKDLEWAGIEWDEGPNIGGPYGPYKQSQRTTLYKEHADHLLETGNAYRCFCSARELDTRARYRAGLGLPPDYDRKCAHIPKEESDDRAAKGDAHVIRLFVRDRYPAFDDIVYGTVRPRTMIKSKAYEGSFDDPILLKSDGFPTYHLANVVDDHLMNITHVIRGAEWMSSTPKHVALYQAFGWSPPRFAHVGLLVDKDRQKLSKRLESMSMKELRDANGVFPETLTNFVALLGWSHNIRSDVLSMQDLIENASMKFTKGDTVVSLEKLWFLQKRHAARYASLQPPKPINPSHDLEELAVKPIMRSLDRQFLRAPHRFSFYRTLPEGSARLDFVRLLLWADALNYTSPDDFILRHVYFFAQPTSVALLSNSYRLVLYQLPPEANNTLPTSKFLPMFQTIYDLSEQDWSKPELKARIANIVDNGIAETLEELKKTNKDLYGSKIDSTVHKSWGNLVHGYIRWATMVGKPGPGGADTMAILGRTESLRRLKVAEDILQRSSD